MTRTPIRVAILLSILAADLFVRGISLNVQS